MFRLSRSTAQLKGKEMIINRLVKEKQQLYRNLIHQKRKLQSAVNSVAHLKAPVRMTWLGSCTLC